MKKQLIQFIAAISAMSLFCGCAIDFNINVKDHRKEDTSAKEEKNVSGSSENVEHDFTIQLEDGTYLGANPMLSRDYALLFDFSDDDFYEASIEWYLPLTIQGDHIKKLTYSSPDSFHITGKHEDCIVDCSKDETFKPVGCDKTERSYYRVAFDYDKIVDRDYKVQIERNCQRGLFTDQYEESFGDNYDLEKKTFIYGGFEGNIVNIFCEFDDGSIQEKSIFVTVSPLDEEGEMLDSFDNAIDVGLALSTADTGDILYARPADGGDRDTVYYGDTVVLKVEYQSQTVECEPSEIEKSVEEIEIRVPSEYFVSEESSEDMYYAFNMCGKFVGKKVGDTIQDEGDFGDTCWWYDYKIKEIVTK